MKWSTGVAHLERLAESCADMSSRSHPFPVLRVVALWVFGDVLGSPRDLDVVHVALAVDLPVPDVPWLTEPAGGQHWANATRTSKNPVAVSWRSVHAPVWNHRVDRPVLLWDADGGVRPEVLDALRSGTAEQLRPPAPEPEERARRLREDLAVSLQALQRSTQEYDDHRWRPGRLEPWADRLWQAADGYLDLLAALPDA